MLRRPMRRWSRSHADAARIGSVDRQTLRDWVRRFNASGPDSLNDAWWNGPVPRLSPAQKVELAQIIERESDLAFDGVVTWRASRSVVGREKVPRLRPRAALECTFSRL